MIRPAQLGRTDGEPMPVMMRMMMETNRGDGPGPGTAEHLLESQETRFPVKETLYASPDLA